MILRKTSHRPFPRVRAASSRVRSTPEKAALAAFFDSYDKAQLDRSPMGKAYRGIRDADYGKWDDLSDAAATADIAATNDALATMRGTFPRTAGKGTAGACRHRLAV